MVLQHNAKIEKYIGKRDDRIRALELKHQFRNYMVNFEHHMRNKQSHMFASETKRQDLAEISQSPGPGQYSAIDTEIGHKKEFSRPVKIFVSPTRNLDGAYARTDPAFPPKPLEEYYTGVPTDPPAKLAATEKKKQKFGLNMLS